MTMYLEHFGLREAPFRITPHTEFFFAGANRGATLEGLLYAITAGEGMVKVTGEVGSGKTMLCRVLMERLPGTVETIYLAVPSLTRDEMLAAIAGELGIETTGAGTNKLVHALQEKLIAVHAAGRQVVALIDEAHAMPPATLEDIRLLSNLETDKEKLLQIVLFGQPELDHHLAAPGMRQLKERITHGFTLAPLPPREVGEYVRFRLRAAGYHGPDLFGAEALRIIAEASEGLTRRINIYADKTLLAAFASGTHTVTPDHARAAVADTQIIVTRRESPRRLGYAAVLGVALGVALGFVLAQFVRSPSPSPANAATPVVAPAAAPMSPTPISATTTIQAPAATASPPAAARPAVASRTPDSLSAHLDAGREILGPASPARYSVQLMVTDANSREYLEGWLAEAGRAVEPASLYVVPAGGGDTPRLGVLYGAFADRGQASEALAALPASLRQFRPYVRPLDAIREDARRLPPR
ncbi:MAG TPA: AAA family ATPase [Usitatibacter sp.]|jgi:type II secretory pathway predicted ATPase ExeA/septal ring-binding cell division protein DamX|nr:AAA family ATPase [Usitatibacter sp.]